MQLGTFLGKLLGSLLNIKPLAKSVLILLGLTAAASAVDGGIHKISEISNISKRRYVRLGMTLAYWQKALLNQLKMKQRGLGFVVCC